MHVLVEAMPAILEAHPDAHCVLVGGDHAQEPDYPAFLRERIDGLSLTEKVTLTGLQSNVPKWMQAMDVIVHASDQEPFGIVVIEAMALGKPVVAGNAAGPTEVITEGVNGLLTPYGDAAALLHAHREGASTTEVAPLLPGIEDGVRGMAFIEAVLASDRGNGAWTELASA